MTTTLFFSANCSRQPSSPSPEGKYTGCWNEENGSLTCITLYLSKEGKVKGERRSKTATNPQEKDEWEAQYKVVDNKIIIGTADKVFAQLIIRGDELIDPNHKVFGKPVVLKKIP
ncbi:hypothetical protein IT6_07525 [Methylacidiphilum caldifontis]|nr:hypothetical protein IT6_07525 [Methylacidiphilum caldifontis]